MHREYHLEFLPNVMGYSIRKHGKANFFLWGMFVNLLLAEPAGFVIYVLILFNTRMYICISINASHLGCLYPRPHSGGRLNIQPPSAMEAIKLA